MMNAMPAEFACRHCFPKARQIAMIGPCVCLFEDEGRYGLMGYPGHRRDEFLYFPAKPYPDPDPECDQETPEADAWSDLADEVGKALTMPAVDGYVLVNSCHKAGWATKRQGECGYDGCRFACWLLYYCGKLIQEWEATDAPPHGP